MQLDPNESEQITLNRFESMLKTNDILFFDSEEFEIIINYYLDNGKMALAKKAIRIGLEQHPSATNLKLYLVEVYIIEGKLEEAEILLDDIYELEKSNEEVYIQKANIHSRKNEHTKAIALLEIALDITLDKSEIWSLIGMEYLFMEDYENALLNFKLCVSHDEENRSALHNVIYCYDVLEKHQEAIDYLLEYVEKRPYSEVAWQNIGKQYYILKQYNKALEAYDFAIISDDAFVGAYLEKGRVLEKLGFYREAIECYVLTLRLEDPTTFALIRAGKCYEKLGDYELAEQFYLQCIDQDTLLEKAWLALINLRMKQKEYVSAFNYVEKAIKLNNTSFKFWDRYAVLSKKLLDYESAIYGYEKCIEISEYSFKYWLKLADVQLKLARWQDAKNLLETAIEKFPNEAEIEYRLAGIYYETFDSKRGKTFLLNALKHDPESVDILKKKFPHVYFNPEVLPIISTHRSKI